MKKTLLVLAALALVSTLFAGGAEAAHRGYGGFSIGASFSVGGFDFALGYGAGSYGGPYADVHYYRTSKPLHYRGYRCHGGCYENAGYAYHHAACPVVAYHFRKYSFDPYASYGSFFHPRYRSYTHYGTPYGYGRYYRHHPKSYRHYNHDRYRYRDWSHRGHTYRDRGREHGRHRYRSDRDRYRSDRHGGDRYRGRSKRYEYRDRGRPGNRDRDRDGARRTRPRRR